jgi:hypothetical protein
MVRYEVRYVIGQEDEPFFPTVTVISCARRNEAISRAKEIAEDPRNRMVEAWQLGADGGDPAIATGLLWTPFGTRRTGFRRDQGARSTLNSSRGGRLRPI